MVVAIIAVASGGVAFALRDSGQTQLEREAQRLVALLDAARAQSRATGVPVYWRADAQGFTFVGLPQMQTNPAQAAPAAVPDASGTPHTSWLAEGTSVQGSVVLTLGPEPIIERQQLVLLQGGQSLRIGTDGLRGFSADTAVAEGVGP